MSHSSKSTHSLSDIKIVVQSIPDTNGQGEENQDNPLKDPALEWELNKKAIALHAKNSNWPEVFKLLKTLSNKSSSQNAYKALAQRIWVALKSDTPALEVVLSLFSLFKMLKPSHEIAGALASLSLFVAKNRETGKEDRELAIGQSQQMMSLVCQSAGIEGEEAFDAWVKEKNLDKPEYFVQTVMASIEIMAADEWWFDRDQLQKEMEEANDKKMKEAEGHA